MCNLDVLEKDPDVGRGNIRSGIPWRTGVTEGIAFNMISGTPAIAKRILLREAAGGQNGENDGDPFHGFLTTDDTDMHGWRSALFILLSVFIRVIRGFKIRRSGSFCGDSEHVAADEDHDLAGAVGGAVLAFG